MTQIKHNDQYWAAFLGDVFSAVGAENSEGDTNGLHWYQFYGVDLLTKLPALEGGVAFIHLEEYGPDESGEAQEVAWEIRKLGKRSSSPYLIRWGFTTPPEFGSGGRSLIVSGCLLPRSSSRAITAKIVEQIQADIQDLRRVKEVKLTLNLPEMLRRGVQNALRTLLRQRFEQTYTQWGLPVEDIPSIGSKPFSQLRIDGASTKDNA